MIGELLRGPTHLIVSSINLGEVHYTLARRKGFATADSVWDYICNSAQVEAPTLEMTRSAAKLVVTSRIPWADAHAAATAMAHGGVVWAGGQASEQARPLETADLRKLGISPRAGRKK